MNENQKQQNNEKTAEEPRKALTPQQIQRRRKMVVFPLMFLAFAGCLWLIFAPSENTGEQQQAGLNTTLPTPEQSGIVTDKRDAYEQQKMQTRQESRMRSLQDFAFALGNETQDDPEPRVEVLSEPDAYRGISARSGSGLHTSVDAYRDLNRQLGSFYEEPAPESDGNEEELQARIEQLEGLLREQQEQQTAEEQQLALIEKSYQMAAKYMNGGQGAGTPQGTGSTGSGKQPAAQPVGRVQHNVVSLLAAPMSDSVFIEEFSKPRNWSFNTAAGEEALPPKNSIGACVYRTMVVTNGREVPLRLTEPMRAGGVLIPANTILTGTARIDAERMSITVNAVQYGGSVIPVELSVYDMDGGEGISVPSSEEVNAVKEIAANMGSGLGSSITITDDAGTQLFSDLGRSVIQGTSQYIGQKMRQVRVTLKAGYRVLLLPPLE